MDEADIARSNTEVLERAAIKAHFNKINTKSAGRIQGLHPSGAGPSSRICQNCGKLIPAARLKANPGATLCVPCQAKFERGGGQ